jgi:hypothetical protein
MVKWSKVIGFIICLSGGCILGGAVAYLFSWILVPYWLSLYDGTLDYVVLAIVMLPYFVSGIILWAIGKYIWKGYVWKSPLKKSK